MKVLSYVDLDTSKVKKQFVKVLEAIGRDDLRTPDVKKLAQGNYYRAKLDDSNRLLLQFVEFNGETVCLALEVILHHAYEKSRFLRGALVDESKIIEADLPAVAAAAKPVRYLNPARSHFHLLDKVISFDETQELVYQTKPPLIVVGSAGSGKTALTLEKLRHEKGDVLYVTHSAYLAQSARDLYFAHGYENDQQEPLFLSLKEFLETLRVPTGREVHFSDFAKWYQRQSNRLADAHQVFEEFRGVLSSRPSGPLTLEDYLALGVRQSIFASAERGAIHGLFLKYVQWLGDNQLFDSNLIAHEWQALAKPSYDFVVIDEVQDITTVQLSLILKTLKRPGQFLLCGDSNQIVHPNFFSWSAVKSLFWQDEKLAERQNLSILRVNFRNAQEVTRVANALLKVKHARFGSVDRESNFLVEAVARQTGSVVFLPDKDTVRRDINQKTKTSTQFAVIVLRDEDKAAAKASFQTPLVFSVHEAKGLEYPNIILYNLISNNRQTFSEITEGVDPAELEASLERNELQYRRAKDKSDKSLEIYKFYINALYVAVTRAIEQVVLIEADQNHPLLRLLKIQAGNEQLLAKVKESSREDWEREAARLELQGKQEQAQAIRQSILKLKPLPWEVLTPSVVQTLETRVFDPKTTSTKAAKALFDHALWHQSELLIRRLQPIHAPARAYAQGKTIERQRFHKNISEKYLSEYQVRNVKGILAECDLYGIDYRNPVNATPLMLAALAGHLELLKALIERGADLQSRDQYGHTALMYALNRAFEDSNYAKGPFADIYALVAPAVIDLQVDDRLVRLYPHQAEYYFLTTMLAGLKNLALTMNDVPDLQKRRRGFFVDYLSRNIEHFPASVLREERKKRQYFNHVLARAEVESSYSPARKLWLRIANGIYMPNPALKLRVKNAQGEDVWQPLHVVFNTTPAGVRLG
jgi:hypothetical protein